MIGSEEDLKKLNEYKEMIFESYKRVIYTKRSRIEENMILIEKSLMNSIPANIKSLKFK
jgi:hypothetical protein